MASWSFQEVKEGKSEVKIDPVRRTDAHKKNESVRPAPLGGGFLSDRTRCPSGENLISLGLLNSCYKNDTLMLRDPISSGVSLENLIPTYSPIESVRTASLGRGLLPDRPQCPSGEDHTALDWSNLCLYKDDTLMFSRNQDFVWDHISKDVVNMENQIPTYSPNITTPAPTNQTAIMNHLSSILPPQTSDEMDTKFPFLKAIIGTIATIVIGIGICWTGIRYRRRNASRSGRTSARELDILVP